MRVIVQRVSRAVLTIEGACYSAIGRGLVALVGIRSTDSMREIEWISNKLANLRVFDDENGVMNKSLLDIPGSGIMLVSNFTLYGDVSRGFRPSYIGAAPRDISEPIFSSFVDYFESVYSDRIVIAKCRFGAMMEIELVNDGPVTLILER